MKIRRCRITALMLSAALLLGGCGSTAASGGNSGNNSAGTDVTKDKTKDVADKTKKAPEIEGLTYESTMDLTYATEFVGSLCIAGVFHGYGGFNLIFHAKLCLVKMVIFLPPVQYFVFGFMRRP